MRRCPVLIAVLLLLSACGGNPAAEGEAEVYYAVVMSEQAQPPDRTVQAVRLVLPEGADPMLFAAERMVLRPDDDALRSAFPDGVTVSGVRLEGDCAVFTFSAEWLEAAGLNKTLAEYCMIKTALRFEGAGSARWEAADADGRMVSGPVLREDMFIDAPLVLVPAWQDIQLYFAAGDGALESEVRPVVLRESESVEWYRQVVDSLIAGPLLTPDLSPVMPERTRRLSVTVENRICYVNFSREFVTNADGGAAAARLTLRALVWSLTELQGVSFVKIRVEGEDLADYFGVDLSLPLERDDERLES
ncbi:MAG: GerMN domain-containing protein [Oscillospiraceae bacterium]|nr:GerMN domain-containing protein [Oscillospiraceae bacterium]